MKLPQTLSSYLSSQQCCQPTWDLFYRAHTVLHQAVIMSRKMTPGIVTWVDETSKLLIVALRELRGLGLLNVSAIQCLPLDNSLGRLTPLFNGVRDALQIEQLLPAYNGGYIAGQNAMLARGRGLRDLISPAQLTQLYESDEDMLWLSAEITENSHIPALRISYGYT